MQHLSRMLLATLAGLAACDLDQQGTEPDPSEGAATEVQPGVGDDGVAAVPADNPAPAQAQNATDVDITAEVRRQVRDQPGLSVDAANVTIMTEGGVVTLRGRVGSAEEKDALVRIASGVHGVTRVQDEGVALEVRAQ